MTKQQLQWHPRVHEQWAQERLVFWRLGFYPTYRRSEVQQALEVVCRRHEIRGRVIYEVFGQHDLLARFWLPRGSAATDVDRDIKRTLTAFHLEFCDMFEVDRIVTHWFWDEWHEGDDVVPPPTDELLQLHHPSHQQLRDLDEIADQFNRGLLTEDQLLSDPRAKDYLAKGLFGIREVNDGIKFAIVVSTSTELSTRYTAMEALGSQLVRTLTNAEPIRERSLYSGNGFGKFLILGKVVGEDFFSINSSLIAPIVDEASLSGVFRTRSITYIGNSPELMSFGESLSLPEVGPDEEEEPVDEILAGGENARVEFKASAFVNVNRWLARGERVEDDKVFDSLARAVVAMLNSEGGGVVVAGVLEASVRDYDEQLAAYPRRDGLILLGIDFDWADWPRQEWDEYAHRLQQKLQARIAPNPMDLVKLAHARVDAHQLCVISASGLSPNWHYLRSGDARFDFVVREGARSVTLAGPDEDQYKKLHPRS